MEIRQREAEVKGEIKGVTKKEEGAETEVTQGSDTKDAVTEDAINDKDLKSSSNSEADVSNKQNQTQDVASGSDGFLCDKSSGVTNGDVTHGSGVTNVDVTHGSVVTNSHTANDVLESDRLIDDGSPNQNVVKESDAESTIEMSTVTAVTNSNETQNGDVTERGRKEASAAATNERMENDRGTEELKDAIMKTEIEDEGAIKGSPDKKNTERANVMELLNDVVSDSERKDQVETATVATATANVEDDSHETEVERCVPPGTGLETKSAISCQEDVANSETSEPQNDADKKNMQDLSACQHVDEGKGFFTMVESAPSSHRYFSISVQPSDQRKFSSALKKEMQLLKMSLPSGIKVKMFEDKMHLFSALIEGPLSTPYEDCLFYFDGYLPDSYPRKPPVVHFHAYCAGKLNPNLYNEGKICVSLLDTWTGKGSEVWTGKSNLLQLLVSIQGLILNSEPYFNEAGYDKHRGTTHGTESSRMYNETVLIKVMQSVTNLIMNPPAVFREETMDFFRVHTPRLTSRVEAWLSQEEGKEDTSSSSSGSGIGYPLFPLSRGFILSAHQVTSNLSSRWRQQFAAASKS
ncbi:putative ubiquitin-conjugating enzyme E2 O [Apostichopus japonicus]|uniref:Putative ubiquitin-conjugating enzyme E2 O n=1 Tax=Stichopus japonicus TaxID=307972 RepID=A0A2G8KUL4_STIJA|nr:putative ubiquitin-conjugating enzyme E2 O [Apostichopus japonicus]